jgi:hypothetical protein
MRRSLLVGGYGFAVLLFSLGVWLVQTQAAHDQTPPNATNVRVDRYHISEVHVNYQLPASGKLIDLYQDFSARGWARDQTAERSLQRPLVDIPTTVFAIFTRHRLFGLISETAVIGMPVDTRSGVNVRQVRCVSIKPWIRCL